MGQEVLQRRPETWRWGMQWPAIRSWQRPIESIIEADPLTITWEVAQELNIYRSMVILHWNKLEKAQLVGVWLQKKKSSFWSVVFPYSMQLYRTISGSDCDVRWKVDFIQPAVTSSVVGPRSSKASLHQKRVMLCLVVGSAVSLIHYSFLNPGETITSEKYTQQIDERHWKLQHLQPLEASIGQQKALSSSPWQFMSHNQ